MLVTRVTISIVVSISACHKIGFESVCIFTVSSKLEPNILNDLLRLYHRESREGYWSLTNARQLCQNGRDEEVHSTLGEPSTWW